MMTKHQAAQQVRDNIIRCRKLTGYSKNEFALKFQSTASNVKLWEEGTSIPRAHTYAQILERLAHEEAKREKAKNEKTPIYIPRQ